MRRDAELSALMRPWNWLYGSLAVILIGVNLLFWLSR